MLTIGITGPSGSGKGEVSKYLASKGARIIDADAVYHDVITPPSACIVELSESFGKVILTDSGAIDRKTLASLVFGEENKEKLEILNKITHKYVISRINDIMSNYKSQGASVCVIDAPLLIEANVVKDCDLTVSVLADESVRTDRIMLRDSIDRSAAEKRIKSQKPDSFYVEHTDETVYNNGDLTHLNQQVDTILSKRRISL